MAENFLTRVFGPTMAKNIDRYLDYLKIDYLQGPVTAYELKNDRLGMHVYLFSDIHVFTETCPPSNRYRIEDFLDGIFRKNPRQIFDYFMEYRYGKGSEWGTFQYLSKDSHISRVEIKVESCLKTTTPEKCPYSNVRFQYADVRSHQALEALSTYIENKQPAIYFKQFFDKETDLFDVGSLFEATKIRKQLDNIDDTKIRTIIERDIETNLADLFAIRYSDLKYGKLETFYRLASDLIVRMVDWYTLGRMFRQYKRIKRGYPLTSAKNVIVYMGGAHVENILRILRKIGFEVLNQTGTGSENILLNLSIYNNDHPTKPKTVEEFVRDGNYQCLNIKNFKQPFFGK